MYKMININYEHMTALFPDGAVRPYSDACHLNGPMIVYSTERQNWSGTNLKLAKDVPARILSTRYKDDILPGLLTDGNQRWFVNGELVIPEYPLIEWTNGTKFYFSNNKLHSDVGPAVITKDEKYWYKNNKLHREDGPAIEWNDRKEWYINGKLHRVDGPAIEITNNITKQVTQEWYQNGVLHRADGPAYMDDDIKAWYFDGKKHRVNDPAVIKNGVEEYWNHSVLHRLYGPAIRGPGLQKWYKDGKLHRGDGPAVIKPGVQKWYINGILTKSFRDGIKKYFDEQGCPHRNGDKPAKIYSDGKVEYYLHGDLHRENGPAIVTSDTQIWCQFGLVHRSDGPAVIIGDTKLHVQANMLSVD